VVIQLKNAKKLLETFSIIQTPSVTAIKEETEKKHYIHLALFSVELQTN